MRVHHHTQARHAIARQQRAALLMVALGLAACSTRIPPATVSPRALGREVPVFATPRGAAPRTEAPEFPGPRDSLSLRDAIALALLHNPELAAFSWEARAREARTLQAGALPNPLLSLLAEDVGASSAVGGAPGVTSVVQPQTTVQLSQVIELGGKRIRRRNLASLGRDLAAWDFETARIEILTDVTHAFINVLAAQQLAAFTARTAQLVGQMQASVSARVVAGVVSPVEETRANVALANARVEVDRANRELEARRLRLAAQWGATTVTFAAAAGELTVATTLPPIAELSARLVQNPDLARWAVEIQQRRSALAAESAKRVPDLTLSAGYRRFSDLQSTAFVIGGSLPIPLFDRNRGSVEEAEARVTKSFEERRAAETRVAVSLADAYGALTSAHAEVTALRATVLPGSEETFAAISEGYRLGRFGYLDLLDAQRSLIGANSQYLRALAQYHKAVADVERLIGEPLSAIPTAPQGDSP